MEEENKQSLFDKLLNSQLYKSIIRSGVPRTRRQRMYAVLGNVFLHLHPARLPRHAVKIGYTFISNKYWGTHMNYQIKKLMFDYIFQFLDKVYFDIWETNYRSQKSIEKQ